MKKKTNKGISIWLLVFALLVFFGIILITISSQKTITNDDKRYKQSETGESKMFESKYLKFSITLPPGYQANDETSRIIFNSQSGQIYVNRNGTQFDNLDSYLNSFDQKTDLNIVSESELSIDGSEAIVRILENTDSTTGQEKIYFVYIDNFVYKISTTERDLFDDLDQIAKSFRYTP